MNLIRKEDGDKDQLLKLDYKRHLWMEKEIKTTANVTRKDGREFLDLASRMNIKASITPYSLEDANKALIDIKTGKNPGSKILTIDR